MTILPSLDSDGLRAAAFDALPMPSAVLDEAGRIVLSNAVDTGGAPVALRSGASIGACYRAVCARMLDDPAELCRNLDAVFAGRQEVFEGEFRGRDDDRERWFHVAVRRLERPGFTGAVVMHHDVTERRRAEERAWHRALHDPLTGLANRTLFRDRLDHAIAAVKRHYRPVALLLLDLDDFKEINDTLGHPVGDRVLGRVAVRAARAVRGSDTVARLGGDEFGVILEQAERPDAARRTAAKLVAAIGEPIDLGDRILRTTASAGIALCPAHALDGDRLIAAADAALYEAKSKDGAQVAMHRPRARPRTVQAA